MTEREFNYIKKSGEKSHYDIFIVEEREDRIYGITKKSLSEEERKRFKEIADDADFDTKKAPIGSIRCFIKKNILD